MSMNKFMHPRNIYKKPPNFKELAVEFPEFRKFAENKFDGSVSFDFKNPDGLRYLTTILLKKDFNLDVIIPDGYLVPTLPLRLNYILWLEDLFNYNQKMNIKGIDIGTGATCIFPLLIAQKNGWKMLATEINESSVEAALENVKKNSLEELIKIKLVSKDMFLAAVLDDTEYDFCMCNPPFFGNEIDLDYKKKSRTGNLRKEPNNCKTGVSEEVLSLGGELEFIRNILRDSLILRNKVKIYTTMMGRKSTMEALTKELQENNIKYCSTQFCQGHTVRWGLAWTFSEVTLQDSLPPPSKKNKPLSWILNSKLNFKECVQVLPELFNELKVKFTTLNAYKRRHLWKIVAFENTWTGLRRKRREMKRMAQLLSSAISETTSNSSDVSPQTSNETIASEATTSVCSDVIPMNKTNEPSKKRPSNDIEEVNVKKLRLSENECNYSNPIVEAVICLNSEKDNKIQIQITSVNGFKEAPQQLMQYLKNRLESEHEFSKQILGSSLEMKNITSS